jgi:hypothetical protein
MQHNGLHHLLLVFGVLGGRCIVTLSRGVDGIAVGTVPPCDLDRYALVSIDIK